MIRFDDVHKRYASGRQALSGVSFSIDDGEMTFLTGHSGAGKSSVLKLIALLERPTRGQVFIDRQNTAGIGPRGIPQFRRQLGVVFQDHKLLHDRPVADNVALPLIIAGVPQREIDKRVRAALDQVGLLGKENSRPLELSTGEQQRVGIARAVVGRPRLLIADEPTGNLDPELALEIVRLFKRFNDVGVTVVIATHDLHLIDQVGARRIVLGDGRIAACAVACAAASAPTSAPTSAATSAPTSAGAPAAASAPTSAPTSAGAPAATSGATGAPPAPNAAGAPSAAPRVPRLNNPGASA